MEIESSVPVTDQRTDKNAKNANAGGLGYLALFPDEPHSRGRQAPGMAKHSGD